LFFGPATGCSLVSLYLYHVASTRA